MNRHLTYCILGLEDMSELMELQDTLIIMMNNDVMLHYCNDAETQTKICDLHMIDVRLPATS